MTKFAFVQLHAKATTRIAGDFLRALVKAVPYRVHTVLTDNGTALHRSAPAPAPAVDEIKRAMVAGELFRAHAFDHACAQLDIGASADQAQASLDQRAGRTDEPDHQRRHGESASITTRTTSYVRHLADFVDAYDFARRLKTLKGLTPYEAICKAWTNDAKRFILNPLHQMPGLNI